MPFFLGNVILFFLKQFRMAWKSFQRTSRKTQMENWDGNHRSIWQTEQRQKPFQTCFVIATMSSRWKITRFSLSMKQHRTSLWKKIETSSRWLTVNWKHGEIGQWQECNPILIRKPKRFDEEQRWTCWFDLNMFHGHSQNCSVTGTSPRVPFFDPLPVGVTGGFMPKSRWIAILHDVSKRKTFPGRPYWLPFEVASVWKRTTKALFKTFSPVKNVFSKWRHIFIFPVKVI